VCGKDKINYITRFKNTKIPEIYADEKEFKAYKNKLLSSEDKKIESVFPIH